MTSTRYVISGLMTECKDKDIQLKLTVDDKLEIDAPQDVLTPSMLARLRSHKSTLIALIERFEERAAIMEYEGGLSRSEAELLARKKCFT
jgi:hypothetical protein